MHMYTMISRSNYQIILIIRHHTPTHNYHIISECRYTVIPIPKIPNDPDKRIPSNHYARIPSDPNTPQILEIQIDHSNQSWYSNHQVPLFPNATVPNYPIAQKQILVSIQLPSKTQITNETQTSTDNYPSSHLPK